MRTAIALAALITCLCGPVEAQRTRPENVPVAIPPPGSYRQSCVDVEFNGDLLYGACRTRAGNLHRSTLALIVSFCASNSDISNLDGVLHCVATPGTYGAGHAKPGGAYWQTCDAELTVVNLVYPNLLSYVCRDRANRNVSGQLDMSACDLRYGIINRNGNLVCGSDPRRLRPAQ